MVHATTSEEHYLRRLMRPAAALLAVLVFPLLVGLATLLGPGMASAQSGPPTEVTLAAPVVDVFASHPKINFFQFQSARSVQLRVPGAADGSFVDLASASVGRTAFEAQKCRREVTAEAITLNAADSDPMCARLMDSKSNEKLVARVGTREVTIAFSEPVTKDSLIIQRQPVPQGSAPGTDPPAPKVGVLPGEVARDTHYLFQDDRAGRWFESSEILEVDPATGRIPAPPTLTTLVQNNDRNDAPLIVLVRVVVADRPGQTELRRLVFESREAEPKGGSTAGFDFDLECQCALDRERSIDDDDPLSACSPGYQPPAAVAPAADRKHRRKRRRKRNAGARDAGWKYLVCVDFTEPRSPRVRVRTTKEGADPDAESGGRHLFAGRDLDVLVWTRDGVDVKVDLGGSAGRRRVVAPVSESMTEGAVGTATSSPINHTPVRVPFAGRSHVDDFVDLEVELTDRTGSTPKTVGHLVHPFSINEVYVGALRVAAAAAWAPWDRTWTTRPRTPGATNPGHEIAIDDGAGSGIVHFEFVAGYTLFWFPVYEHERTVSAGSFFGLGVVGTDPAQGIAAFTSLHLAPVELTIGRYFGVALDVSVRRTKRLRSNLGVGSPVLDGAEITRFGATPTFGIVFNLGPQFAKTVGMAHKGYAR